ncbi:hypothetical protein CEQ90_07180 [Lewinellaceae bacterium SD302]|nr:hypothetical protein CEQ90_07180 [Lewinellaceae bacterium SD302]
MRLLFILHCLVLTLTNTGCQSREESPSETVSSASSKNRSDDHTLKPDTSTIQLKFTTGIRSILEDRHGNTWFGSHNEGLAKLSEGKFTYYTTESGLSDNQVRSIYEAQDGTVWFECGQGLSVFDGKQLMIVEHRDYSRRNEWKIEPGDLWFKGNESIGYNTGGGTAGHPGQIQFGLDTGEKTPGVYRYANERLYYHAFPAFSMEGNGNSYSISTPFARGKNHQIWFGMYSAVVGYDGNAFTVFTDDSLNFNATTGYLHVRSLYEDSRGILWIGNNGIGVLRYDGNEVINFSKQHDLVSEGSQNRGGFRSPTGSLEHVFAIGEDRVGNIWFGDRDTGAWRFDGKTVKNYSLKNGLPVHHIWQIYNAKNGELWFAMGDGCVQKFNGRNFERVF